MEPFSICRCLNNLYVGLYWTALATGMPKRRCTEMPHVCRSLHEQEHPVRAFVLARCFHCFHFCFHPCKMLSLLSYLLQAIASEPGGTDSMKEDVHSFDLAETVERMRAAGTDLQSCEVKSAVGQAPERPCRIRLCLFKRLGRHHRVGPFRGGGIQARARI